MIRQSKLQIAESPTLELLRLAHPCSRFRKLLCCVLSSLLLISCCGNTTQAANPKPSATQRLLDRTPFDQVILNKVNGGKTLEVLPLNLPQRPLTSIPATGALKVRLLGRPTEEFEIAWSNIAQVRVFEQVLLDEAQRLTAAGKFDEAYDYYARLGADFSSLSGLNDAICNYLRLNALRALSRQTIRSRTCPVT